MDPGLPPLHRTPAPPAVEAVYTKGLLDRSAFRTWASSVGALLIAGLSGQMAWKDVAVSAGIATITAALALFLGSDSIGVTTPKE